MRHRQRLSRASRGLARAVATGDPAKIAAAVAKQEAVARSVLTEVSTPASRTAEPVATAAEQAGERRAVSVYTGGEFTSINAYVQAGYQVPSWASDDQKFVGYMAETVTALERAVDRAKLTTQTRVTRAIWSTTADDVYGPVGSQIGQTVSEARFTSTTTTAEPSASFGDVKIVFHLAPGTSALDVTTAGVPVKAGEHELLLGPHQPLRIVSDHIAEGGASSP